MTVVHIYSFSAELVWNWAKKIVVTLPELHAMVKEAYTPRPECRDLQYIFDISGWLAEHIVSIKNHI